MKSIIITHESDIDQRLDKFIKKFLPNAPLGAIYKMLRTGKIKLNGKKSDQKTRIQQNDEIILYLSDNEISALQTIEIPEMTQDQKKTKKIDILYQDDDILVVNKPPKINVHPGDHKTREISLIEEVHDFLGKKYNTLTFKPSLVHRIDRDTSGCVIIALNKPSLENLLAQLQNHKIEKIYHAIVVGVPNIPRDTIFDKLLRRDNARDEAKVIVHSDGQRAVTHYRTLKEFSCDNNLFSLLECRIETGRTHQIRVHLSHRNVPILGDRAYGNKSINAFVKRNYNINRQCLHAFSLQFIHPKTHKKITITAPYQQDMQNFIN